MRRCHFVLVLLATQEVKLSQEKGSAETSQVSMRAKEFRVDKVHEIMGT